LRHHEVEGVSAITAEKFVVVSAAFRKSKEMSGEQTNQRMFDDGPSRVRFQKGMTASTRIFGESLPHGDGMNGVAEEVAEVSNLFLKQRLAGIRVFPDFEQQGMAALPAHIFVVTVALGDPRVGMTEYKAGHGMRNTRLAVIEIIDSAHAMARCSMHSEERNVAYTMSEENTC